MAFLGWISGVKKDDVTTAEEDDEIVKRAMAWGMFVIIGLLSVIIAFLFVEMK